LYSIELLMREHQSQAFHASSAMFICDLLDGLDQERHVAGGTSCMAAKVQPRNESRQKHCTLDNSTIPRIWEHRAVNPANRHFA
jgi:hypothetical protein